MPEVEQPKPAATPSKARKTALGCGIAFVAVFGCLGVVAGIVGNHRHDEGVSTAQPDPATAATSAPRPGPKPPLLAWADEEVALAARYRAATSKISAPGAVPAMSDADLAAALAAVGGLNKNIAKVQARYDDLRLTLQLPAYFTITGEIKDVTADQVLIWGKALPTDGGRNPAPGAVIEDATIVVEKPIGHLGVGFLYDHEHSFIGRSTGRNAFGGEVPVWRYGPIVGPTPEQLHVHEASERALEEVINLASESDVILQQLSVELERRKQAAPRAP